MPATVLGPFLLAWISRESEKFNPVSRAMVQYRWARRRNRQLGRPLRGFMALFSPTGLMQKSPAPG